MLIIEIFYKFNKRFVRNTNSLKYFRDLAFRHGVGDLHRHGEGFVGEALGSIPVVGRSPGEGADDLRQLVTRHVGLLQQLPDEALLGGNAVLALMDVAGTGVLGADDVVGE